MNVAEAAQTVQFDSQWVSACMRISEEAHLRLPKELHGRIEMGTALAINNGIRFDAQGNCEAHSERDDRWYHVTADTCECPDWAYAMQHKCKHVLGRKIMLKAQKLLQQEHDTLTGDLDSETGATAAEAEMPTEIPAQYIVRLHGKPYLRYAGLLHLAHQRGLVSLKARFISVTPELALAEAEATFADGRVFVEAADSTPANCGAQVRQHFPRLALVRAKGRALRDALNLGDICAFEELGE